ncbi:hypothetical protein DIURU_003392 [Diutina rugosa]|uniref:Uncharacterized protein n=1 Tax=Diutina rugosa TaxID=5481 RepID=A0A642UKM3_DIURU|nr:uncharacterized protein DIURU_003392 [Diutina rugosa]KAA8901022.1 hypothetical protein DIURU_003392 [Diutina rugosa]
MRPQPIHIYSDRSSVVEIQYSRWSHVRKFVVPLVIPQYVSRDRVDVENCEVHFDGMSKLGQVFWIAGIIRVVVPTIYPQIVDTLAQTVEISTPINSFETLKEAFFYIRNGINLYDGDDITIPPVYVALMQLLDWPYVGSLLYNLLFTAIDLWIAWRMVAINRWYQKHQTRRLGKYAEVKGFNDDLIASFVLFNPLIILTCISHSTLPVQVVLIVESIYQVCVGHSISRSAITLGVASYIGFTPVYLAPSIFALAHALKLEEPARVYVHGIAILTTTIMLLALISATMTGSTQFLTCYKSIIWGDKISPNTGLWWYLFTEMFEFFTPFYTAVFNIYHFIFIFPITVRLFEFAKVTKKDRMGVSRIAVDEKGNFVSIDPDGTVTPLNFGTENAQKEEPQATTTESEALTTEATLTRRTHEESKPATEVKKEAASESDSEHYNGDSLLAVVLCFIWLSFSKSYPVIGDLGYGVSFLAIFKNTALAHCSYLFPVGLTFVVCLLLSPIFYYCWIVLGNGNSNFFYSINLIWGVVHALIMMDVIWGKLIFDYIVQHQLTEADKKDLQLTQL